MVNFVFKPLHNNKIWALTKLKALADDLFNVAKMLISLFDKDENVIEWCFTPLSTVFQRLKFVLGRVKNIVRKQENACYQHFLPFLQYFQKASYIGLIKVTIVC